LLSDAHSNQSGPYYGRITRPVVTFLLAKLALNSTLGVDDKRGYPLARTYTLGLSINF
jgi:hypothetical protein